MVEVKIYCNRCGNLITKEDSKEGSQQISIPVFGEETTSIIKLDLHKKCLGVSLKNMFKDFKIEPETTELPKCDYNCEDCDLSDQCEVID